MGTGSRDQSNPASRTHGVEAGEPTREECGTQRGGIEQHRRTALCGHLPPHGASHDVARRELGVGVRRRA